MRLTEFQRLGVSALKLPSRPSPDPNNVGFATVMRTQPFELEVEIAAPNTYEHHPAPATEPFLFLRRIVRIHKPTLYAIPRAPIDLPTALCYTI